MKNAREELGRIDTYLATPHLLIGGLAVQQYYQPRVSEDIDLVCQAETANALISRLYPTKAFIVQDKNDDMLRPAWVITERGGSRRTTFIGPKILEREAYPFVDYSWIMQRAVRYKQGDVELRNIFVPNLETMALLKLLSLTTRLTAKGPKGEQDLEDFVNLTNLREFKFNIFLDSVTPECREHLATGIAQLTQERGHLFLESSLSELFELMFPPRIQPLSSDAVVSVYSPKRQLTSTRELQRNMIDGTVSRSMRPTSR